ncbi:MAG TPA: M23 family metallopeptidase [Bacillota bacterium]|nr:M23 family metallopeptidase [Bacillota bacterium]
MKHDSIKRRREERLRQLREQSKHKHWLEDFSGEGEEQEEPRSYSSSTVNKNSHFEEWDWDHESQQTKPEELNRSSKFLIKTVLALFLLSVVYLLKQSGLPYTEQANHFVKQAFTREYNFAGTMDLVERYVGKTPEILLTFSPQKKGVQPVWKQNTTQHGYEKPLNGAIVSPFVMDGKGIQIEAKAANEVKAVGEGWVISVGQKEGLGQTLIIQHADHTQSWYSNIDHIQVGEQDWVGLGQVIGKVKPGKNLYFSMLRDDRYFDPTSVIAFD